MYSGYYIVVSKVAPDYSQVISSCKTKQDEKVPQNVLSEAELNDGTVMIKIPYANDDWKDSTQWKGDIITKFTADDKEARLKYYYDRQDAADAEPKA